MKLNKKGFTLIELLAVIVVLGIILAIAIPKVTSSIEDSKKGAFNASVKTYIKAAQQYVATKEVEGKSEPNGTIADLPVNNKEGWSGVWTNNNGLITIDEITDGKTIVKNVNSQNIDSNNFKSQTINNVTIVTYSTDNTIPTINYHMANTDNDGLIVENELLKGTYTGGANVIIPDTVTKIDLIVFYGLSMRNVIFPNTLKEIGISSFAYNSLENIVLPEGLEKIEGGAFAENNITSVIIPSSVKIIGENAFANNQNLTKIIVKGKSGPEDFQQAPGSNWNRGAQVKYEQ